MSSSFTKITNSAGETFYVLNRRSHKASSGKSLLSKRIMEACMRIGGKAKVRINIADICATLCDISMKDVHAELLKMSDTGAILLYRNDASGSLTKADKDCALMVGGFPRHLVYVM